MKKIINFLKPEWISKVWREGSMGASDKQSTFWFCIGGTAVLVLIYAMLYFNLFGTYLYEYYIRAGFVAHVVSWIAALGSLIAIWKAPDAITTEKKGWVPAFLVLVLLAAAIIVGAGFDFSLRGIE